MLLKILSPVIVISFLVLIHELGHFYLARRFGMHIQQFSIGFGPPIFQLTRNGTIYRIGVILFGGYVAIKGVEPSDEPPTPDAFRAKPFSHRIVVLLSGSLFNLFSAYLVCMVSFLLTGISVIPYTTVEQPAGAFHAGDVILKVADKPVRYWDDFVKYTSIIPDSVIVTVLRDHDTVNVWYHKHDPLQPLIPPVIGAVKRDGPAWRAGLRIGDRIIAIDTIPIISWNTLVTTIRTYQPGDTVYVKFTRNDTIHTVSVVLGSQRILENGTLRNVAAMEILIPHQRIRLGLHAPVRAATEIWHMILLFFRILKQMLTHQLSPSLLGGPLSLIQVTATTVGWGLSAILRLFYILSTQLAIFNLCPLPPLDGGLIFLTFIERMRHKPFTRKGYELAQTIGWLLLILLLIYVSYNDIQRIFKLK